MIVTDFVIETDLLILANTGIAIIYFNWRIIKVLFCPLLTWSSVQVKVVITVHQKYLHITIGHERMFIFDI